MVQVSIIFAVLRLISYCFEISTGNFISTIAFLLDFNYDERLGVFKPVISCDVPFEHFIGNYEEEEKLMPFSNSFLLKSTKSGMLEEELNSSLKGLDSEWVTSSFKVDCVRPRSYVYFIYLGCLELFLYIGLYISAKVFITNITSQESLISSIEQS